MSFLQGWILAPSETQEDFLKRKKNLNECSLPRETAKVPLYDLEVEFCSFESNESLFPWQGAVLWEYFIEKDSYPVIQLRKKLSNRNEVLAHELVHAARFAFKEPFFEEVLAYRTSKSWIRRFFGPFFINPFESGLWVVACCVSPIFSFFLEPLLGVFVLLGLFFLFFYKASFPSWHFYSCEAQAKKNRN